MRKPVISIITPVWTENPNSKDFIEDLAITTNSVYGQTSDNYEWIVVFDGLDVDYFRDRILMSEFEWSLKHVKLARLGFNYGPSVARNVAFQLSHGDIITYVDCGDELLDTRVEKLVDYYESNPNKKFIMSEYALVDRKKDLKGLVGNARLAVKDLRRVLEKGNVSTPIGIAHTRDIFIIQGGFQPGIVCGEDGILWRRMFQDLKDDEVGYLSGLAGTSYVKDESQSTTQRRFSMGSFAFDGDNFKGSHAQYIDNNWFTKFHSKDFYEREYVWEEDVVDENFG